MGTPDEKINIIIADDHPIFLAGLKGLLSDFKHIHIIGTAQNGNEVLDLLREIHADIVITDINMPEMDGIKLTKEIVKNYPNTKILALTMHTEGSIVTSLIKKGCSGYILKDSSKEELLNAITTLHAGRNFFSSKITSSIMENLMSNKKTHSTTSSLIVLSDREKEILQLISKEYTQQQIADKLFISSHTVVFHRRKLLYKFDVKNTAGLIKSAIDNGFLE